MKIVETALGGVFILEPVLHRDDRGSFRRAFDPDQMGGYLGTVSPAQINLSENVRAGTVRGLHYQAEPWTETKIVQCVRGRILDVAVDFRRDSPTFLQHVSCELGADVSRLFVIPPGCAHGFQTLEDHSSVLYIHSGVYRAEADAGLRYDDSRLGLRWPLPVSAISAKDAAWPLLNAASEGVRV